MLRNHTRTQVLETKLGQEVADRLAAFVDEHKDLKCNELIAEIN